MAAVDKACTGNGSLDSGESFSRSFTVKTRPPQPVSGRVRFKSYLNAGGARELHTCASTVSFMGGCRVNDARFSPTRTSRYLMTTRYTYTWGPDVARTRFTYRMEPNQPVFVTPRSMRKMRKGKRRNTGDGDDGRGPTNMLRVREKGQSEKNTRRRMIRCCATSNDREKYSFVIYKIAIATCTLM